MDAGLLIAAAEVHEEAHSTTPFVVAGLILAAFAVVVATIGILRPNLGDNV